MGQDYVMWKKTAVSMSWLSIRDCKLRKRESKAGLISMRNFQYPPDLASIVDESLFALVARELLKLPIKRKHLVCQESQCLEGLVQFLRNRLVPLLLVNELVYNWEWLILPISVHFVQIDSNWVITQILLLRGTT